MGKGRTISGGESFLIEPDDQVADQRGPPDHRLAPWPRAAHTVAPYATPPKLTPQSWSPPATKLKADLAATGEAGADVLTDMIAN